MSKPWRDVSGGVTAPAGFTAAGISCGLKKSGAGDLALIVSEQPAEWTALLTASRAPAAPVLLTREMLRRGRPLQAILANSGNANSATGAAGLEAARRLAAAAASDCGLPEGSAVMASTGIIGVQLPEKIIRRALPRLVRSLSRNGGRDAAEAIMTTDRVPKETALEIFAGRGTRFRIGAMAKGAGMIDPRLATMLAFITIDAAVARPLLRRLLKKAVERSFNRITVDGDCSTNDTVLAMANSASGVGVRAGGDVEAALEKGLAEVCRRLAAMIVRDGEGATKLVEVRVTGARSREDALRAARAVANSTLVKTAWFGQDLNWGRIFAALGYSGAALEPEKIAISLNGAPVVAGGAEVPRQELSRARRQMRRRELNFLVDLGLGRGEEAVLTCDLSLEYVKENSLYTT